MGETFKLIPLKNSSKKLNICLVYPGYPPYEQESGGIASYVQENANFLASLGHKVTIISRTPAISHIIKKNTKNIKVIYLPHFMPHLSKFFTSLKFNKFGAYFYAYKVYKQIKHIEQNQKMPFDIIETSDWGAEGYFLVKKFPNRTIIKCDTPSFISEEYNPNNPAYLSTFVKFLEKRTLLNAKNIVTNSKILMEKIGTVLQQNVHYTTIQLSMNTIPVQKKVYANRFSKNNPMKIIFSGRIEERKGIFNLIKAVKKLRELGLYIELHCFGATTPMKSTDSITLLEQKKYKWLHFYGAIPRNQMIKQYRNYDLCIVPSLFDSFCLSALEAMLSKLPTIVSDSTGISDLMPDKRLVFSLRSDMSQKIKEIYFNYSAYVEIMNSLFTGLMQQIKDANKERLAYYLRISAQNS